MKRLIIQPSQPRQGATKGTYLDWFMRLSTVSIAFCYREQLDFERLSRALALVLNDFPDFAGRLRVSPGAIDIEHGETGARLEFAERDESFEALIAVAKSGQSKLLCPQIQLLRALWGRAPLFAARLTHTCDGSILSVTWQHSIGDMQSSMMFLDAWAHAYSEQPHPRALDLALADRELYHEQHLQDSPGVTSCMRVFRVTEAASAVRFMTRPVQCVDFEFPQAELAQLQAAAMPAGVFVTAHDALCAQLFSVLRQLPALTALSQVAMLINYRKRCGLPTNLLGNLISPVFVTAEPAAELSDIASALRIRLEEFATRHVNYHATRRFIAACRAPFQRQRCMHEALDSPGNTLLISSWAGFGMYALKFGRACPALCVPLLDAPGPLLAIVIESPEQRGLTVSVYLPAASAEQATSLSGRAAMHAYAHAELNAGLSAELAAETYRPRAVRPAARSNA